MVKSTYTNEVWTNTETWRVNDLWRFFRQKYKKKKNSMRQEITQVVEFQGTIDMLLFSLKLMSKRVLNK